MLATPLDNQRAIAVLTAYQYRFGCWRRATEYFEVLHGRLPGSGQKASNFRSQYGISLLTWEAMFRYQDGRCAICGETGGDKGLVVDHCHVSGRVRGLLCSRCNVGLGTFRDDEMFLDLASLYVMRRGGGQFSRAWSVWDKCPYIGLSGVKAADNVGQAAPQ